MEETPLEWSREALFLLDSFANSESCRDDSTTPRNALGNDEGDAGPLSLSTKESLRGRFTGEAFNFRLPCTATENNTCQIVGHLSAWNESLFLACWQLQEMPASSGGLSLVLFRHPNSSFRPSQQLNHVIQLVCHLLKTHRCVTHVEFDLLLLEQCNHELLSNVLRRCQSIARVKLTFRGSTSGEDLATAALCLPHLQELECSLLVEPSETLVNSLSTLLQSTKSLTTLRVSGYLNYGRSSEKLLQALARTRSSLKELVLPGRLIAEAGKNAQTMFAGWLKKTTSLSSLTVLGEWTYLELSPLNGILQGILGNTSITAVDIQRPKLYQADVPLLSEIIEQNKVLRSLKISYEPNSYKRPSSFKDGPPNTADSYRCLKALVENHSLVEVALPIDFWDEYNWKELFKALPAKMNLERVSIEAPDRAPFVDELCVAIKETGAGDKVSFNASHRAWKLDESFECTAFSSVAVRVYDDSGADVCGILERMPSLGHITCLELSFLFQDSLCREVVSALGTFLGVTRTLKTLSLSLSSLAQLVESQEVLMEGLAVNRSLREVRIEADEAGCDFSVFSEPLADVINGSKNISRLNLTIKNDAYDEGDYDENAFTRLAEGIAENYTLLDLTASECMFTLGSSWFKITDTTRRNQGLLTCAADFARGARRDRRCAVALERMQGYPQLVEEVARLEGVDQTRAATMVQGSLRSIQSADMHQFMRLAGVVRERVSCRASKDGHTQLDALNEDCWRALRRYLWLGDIRDATAGSLPPQ